jgi:hypothetical protein
MRTTAGVLASAVAVTSSFEASAQLEPQPIQPAPVWGQPAQPPPPASGPLPQQGATVQPPNAADSAGGTRRPEIVYVNAEVGRAAASSAGQWGVGLGLGAGLRILYWTFGLRARVIPSSQYTFLNANLEAGFHLPLGAWDPYVGIHGGYVEQFSPVRMSLAPITSTATSSPPTGATSTSGGDLGGCIGVDYYLTTLFSVGLDVTLDGLFGDRSNPGAFAMGSAHGGLHFEL